MEVLLKKTQGKFQFEATNHLDWMNISSSKELDPESNGFRPTELLLVSLAGCLSIDILNILYKKKCIVSAHDVVVRGVRAKEIPGIIETIDLHITISGSFSEDQLKHAIKLSVDTYCTVYKILIPSAKINIDYTII